MRLKPFVEDALDALCPKDEVARLLCHPSDDGKRAAVALAAAMPRRRVLLAIGPEGGWIDYELELLRNHDFAMVTLGPRILTTELAVPALITLVTDAMYSVQNGV
eukprot:gnl/TRDRNA2_/TRDRNA2_87279_c1_seq2.p1 gnl/TRDRNA2_/TRDRNA2_87279_c1~~gnl/TRDRNA2_/TRDRNA2_87279_c1_seq2.p1  ORF type:complete len:105 (+),score=15.88 gnl/TRDRNA2_/TRDRNA2_87279_c1_seq2:105-419(+)